MNSLVDFTPSQVELDYVLKTFNEIVLQSYSATDYKLLGTETVSNEVLGIRIELFLFYIVCFLSRRSPIAAEPASVKKNKWGTKNHSLYLPTLCCAVPLLICHEYSKLNAWLCVMPDIVQLLEHNRILHGL